MQAATLYRQALSKLIAKEDDGINADELCERMAICYEQAAFQAADMKNFDRLLTLAIQSYKSAVKFLKATNVNGGRARSAYFRANITRVRAWLSDDVKIRKGSLKHAISLGEIALNLQLATKAAREAIDSCCLILSCFDELHSIETDPSLYRKMIQKCVPYCERVIDINKNSPALLSPEDEVSLCRLYSKAAQFYNSTAQTFASEADRDRYLILGAESGQVAQSMLRTLDNPVLDAECLFYLCNHAKPNEAAEVAERLLPKIISSGNKLLASALRDLIAYSIRWKIHGEQDPKRVNELFSEIQKITSETEDVYSRVRPVGINSGYYSDLYYSLTIAQLDRAKLEFDPEKRKRALDDVLAACERYAEQFIQYADRIGFDFLSSEALALKANLCEADSPLQRLYLVRSLEHSKKNFEYHTRRAPFWNMGLAATYYLHASAIFEVAKVERNKKKRRDLLKQAIKHVQRAIMLRLNSRVIGPGMPDPVPLITITIYRFTEGRMWRELFSMDGQKGSLFKILELSNEAKKVYNTLNMPGKSGEIDYEAGLTFGLLQDYKKSSESFEEAALQFTKASTLFPTLDRYFIEYSTYMRALARIANAKARHQQGDYEAASRSYNAAYRLLETSSRWKHLASFYQGCESLEAAEDLSQKDLQRVSRLTAAFRRASDLFAKSHRILLERFGEIEISEDVDRTKELIENALLRQDYCDAKSQFLEASANYREGELALSAKQYQIAAKLFDKLCSTSVRTEWDQDEITSFANICKASQMMAEAEINQSSKIYERAAAIFSKAAEKASNEASRSVARGNASQCLAISSVLEFKVSKGIAAYQNAKLRFSEAYSEFLRAGLQRIAQTVKASEQLLDEYAYPDKGGKGRQLEEKRTGWEARSMFNEKIRSTEKELVGGLTNQESSGDFSLSIARLFAARTEEIPSRLVSPSTLPNERESSDSEFQSTSVQLAIKFPGTLSSVSQPLPIKIDMINTSRNRAFLLKLVNLVPDGVSLSLSKRDSDNSSFSPEENGSIQFHGKRIEPFEGESISLLAHIQAPGQNGNSIMFQPKIYYSDETGRLFSNVLKEDNIYTVPLPRTEFTFKKEKSKLLFDCLLESFTKDYQMEKLPVERSGWRSFVEIARQARLSTSAIYGRGGGVGPYLGELLKRGCVESKIYRGSRGRGGQVIKVRIAYEKEEVRDYVKQEIQITASR